MTHLISIPTIPVFGPCTAGKAQGLERAVNIRVDMDGDVEVYQVVDGIWTKLPDAVSLPPSLQEDWPCNVSAYFEYAYCVQDASYY